MKKEKVLCFQPKRLEQFAKKLILNDINPRVKMINVTSEILLKDDGVAHDIPAFYGPISQLPRIFRNEWTFSKHGEYIWKDDQYHRTISSLLGFFGLSVSQLTHIFIPGCQSLPLYGGVVLSPYAKSKEIGFNIIHLIKSQQFAMDLHILNDLNLLLSKN